MQTKGFRTKILSRFCFWEVVRDNIDHLQISCSFVSLIKEKVREEKKKILVLYVLLFDSWQQIM